MSDAIDEGDECEVTGTRSPKVIRSHVEPVLYRNSRNEAGPLVEGDEWWSPENKCIAIYTDGHWVRMEEQPLMLVHSGSNMEISVSDISRICHEVNRAYCLALGDISQHDWDSAPDWQKESIRAGVLAHMDNPQMSPEQSHASWMTLKQSEGWVYGLTKDFVMKTHPCMLPYEQLPLEQRIKDHIFKAICNVIRQQAALISLE